MNVAVGSNLPAEWLRFIMQHSLRVVVDWLLTDYENVLSLSSLIRFFHHGIVRLKKGRKLLASSGTVKKADGDEVYMKIYYRNYLKI